jgi:uncharacterized protein (DUF169 family)
MKEAPATGLSDGFGLDKPPVAIGFFDEPPLGVTPWNGSPVPAGCVFWKKAQEGQVFYTTPADHYNCAIGAHTHKIPLPAERSGELEGTIGFMVKSEYLKMAEVPGIPTLAKTPAIIAFGPVDRAPFAPDIVLIAGKPSQMMLLYEAALQAGLAPSAGMSVLGRPACAALPLALQSGSTVLSLGCKGNRTFTGLPDAEMYLCLPGAGWAALLEQFERTDRANRTMGAHYATHQAKFDGA